jgi:hypothetical protein
MRRQSRILKHPLRRRLFHQRNRPTGLPDGQITDLPVQPHLQKYSPSFLTQISSLSRAVLSHRGAARDRHRRGAGCGGRGSVGRCQGMAGRVDMARELTNGTQTDDAWPVEAFWLR